MEENTYNTECNTQDNTQTLTLMEECLNTTLPKYLKILLSYTGYDSFGSFHYFKDWMIDRNCNELVNDLENFATTDFLEIADTAEIQLVYEAVYKKIYKRRIEDKTFCILQGHKKSLLYFVKKCVQYLENKQNDICQYCGTNLKQNRDLGENINTSERGTRKRKQSDSDHLADKVKMKNKEIIQKSQTEYKLIEESDEDKAKIEEHVTRIATNYMNRKTSFSPNQLVPIRAQYEEPTLVKLTCPIKKCLKKINVVARESNSSKNWILFNFNRHIAAMHISKDDQFENNLECSFDSFIIKNEIEKYDTTDAGGVDLPKQDFDIYNDIPIHHKDGNASA